VSWQTASFVLLAVALAAGFVWHERTRPSSKLVALVATLAALAALGRVAFAALPDVKPTTDIVLISGYALGAAPGYAVGAVATLTSNLFFGQGPWTPWQMFAWGLTGVVGALLARISPRPLGRWPLAVACALMGLVFGAILNLYTFISSGGQTWAQFVAISGQALPFDVAHAVSNLLFALAFGPVLLRSLTRFRARLQVTWRPLAPAAGPGAGPLPPGAPPLPPGATGGAGPLPLVLVLALALAGALAWTATGSSPARAAARNQSAARAAAADPWLARGVGYLGRAQNADGGLGGDIHQPSSQLYTAWATMGLAAAGTPPGRVMRSGRSPVSFMVAGAGRLGEIGDLERTILALRAGGASAASVGGHNLVAELLARRASNGSFANQTNLTAFAILALRASGRAPGDATVSAAASWLSRQQDRDGGFNFAGRGGASDIDDSAAAVEALVSARRSGGVGARALGFLVAHQNPDGGFPLIPGQGSNAQSAAWAVQALVAGGRNPDRVRRGSGRSPLAYLRSLMGADGSVRYSRTSRQTPVWVTGQALAALARAPLPIFAKR
jgi:energy-coupling factor transport system substrate-specific component